MSYKQVLEGCNIWDTLLIIAQKAAAFANYTVSEMLVEPASYLFISSEIHF